MPALDGLRGLAVVAVLLFHAGYLDGGWLGVDLFFVLSGYLITSLLLIEHKQEGAIGLASFWGRRARRLLPALLVLVAAVSLYAWFEVARIDLGRVRSDGLATLFFVANWHDIANGVSYWDRGLAPSMFAHTWSLAVEEQLYLVWPIAVAFVLRGRRARPAATVARWALIAAAASAALAIGLRAGGASVERIYLGTDTRAVAVALGAFVAGWRRTRRRSDAFARRTESIGIGAAAVLAVAWWGLDGTASFTYWGGLLGASVLAAVLVAAAADVRSTRMAGVLGVAPLRALGIISYGLYLWHWPIYVACSPQHTGLRGPALLAFRLGLSLAAATASWFLVERPIRHRRPAGWWEGRRGAGLAVAGMALAVVALFVATSAAISVPTQELGSGVVRPKAVIAGAPEVVVLGDSVAASIAAPAVADPRAYGLDVVRSTVLGCQAVWDGAHRARGTEKDISLPAACPAGVGALVARERPDAVLVLYGGWTNADLEVAGRWVGACDASYQHLLRTRFAALLADARISGAPVFVADAPRSTNTFRQADTWDRTACTNAVMASVASATPGVKTIDLDGWLCPGGTCKEQVDGVPIRSDGVHFQGPGGTAASKWIFGEVARRAGLHRPALDASAESTTRARALGTVCRSYERLLELTDTRLAEVARSAPERRAVEAGVRRLDPKTLAALDPAMADDLSALADPVFQAWVHETLVGLTQGHLPNPGSLPQGVHDGLDRGLARLKATC
ncbi:acyltransferase family protein [Aquihabitans sp. McL0605]|uniref:acyltransferase family protein n=1 Tax=Aquihabitans sp. McL0605 TaxID=3415671 RepID=UPI003CEB59E0